MILILNMYSVYMQLMGEKIIEEIYLGNHQVLYFYTAESSLFLTVYR